MAKISFKISATGLNKVLNALDDAPKRIRRITQAAGREIAEFAAEEAQRNYNSAQYDGVNDVEVSVRKTADNLWNVEAHGEAAPYIEYGTGKMRGTGLGKVPARYQGPAPTQAHDGVYKGDQARWGFYEFPGTEYTAGGYPKSTDHGTVGITRGNPPNDCMYHAKKAAAKEALSIVKDKYLAEKGFI